MGKKASEGAKYSPANQADPALDGLDLDVREAEFPEKPENTTRCQKCAYYSCFVGLSLVIAAVIAAIAMRPLIEGIILKKLPIAEGKPVFSAWKTPPVSPVMYFRAFNLTNEDAFLRGEEKPKLQEVGPYAYRQVLTKEDVKFTESGEVVGHTAKRVFHWAPEISNGTEDDVIVMPNVPLLGAVNKMRADGRTQFEINAFVGMLRSFQRLPDGGPFIKVSVKEYLWGYKSILYSLKAINENPKCQLGGGEEDSGDDDDFFSSDDDFASESDKQTDPECEMGVGNVQEFGLFMMRNLTHTDPRELYTGLTDLSEKGFMVSWHKKKVLDYWEAEECNSLEDVRAPGMFPIDMDKTDALRVFIGGLCRTIEFKYKKEVRHGEFLTWRFVPLANTLDSPRDNPENACYCRNKRDCLPTGIQDVSPCKGVEKSPVYVSWPHFMYGDPELRRGVEGLSPDAEKHEFFFDIEPGYGITLASLGRFQLNALIERDTGGFGFFDNISEERVFLPFAWMEEGVEGPSEAITERVTKLLSAPQTYPKMIAFILILVALLMIIPEIFFWVRSCFRKYQKEGKDDCKGEQ